ncbi:RusA family crossover junction endodeoxyribonuclease [Blastococcus sp. BMG 814]|uniref:RusA family crossover junction endodeoxyribonuclease n=1 Tax=Blastococcus carthaginiensis TaxID=3050034 RepID=A0ABT9IGT5_9ACTN|nr:RusA family crossover junction endodeoxyribonuclease [Blastococcus carthaginiensis]MDP5184783.1 RusA family crossover junction endodeoxyribonuclease [Blastococcus carthaginiensis]
MKGVQSVDPLSPGGGKKGVGTADPLGVSTGTDILTSSEGGAYSAHPWERLEGPVSVSVVFTFDPPKSAPKSRRCWPVTRSSGDLDKLCRAVFDALTDAGVWRDDSQVVRLAASKVHVGDPWSLHVPGACVTVRAVGS